MTSSIDDVLGAYLGAVEDYFRLKGELEDVMKQGYMDISKARYIMGVTSVSPYQYDNDMTATAVVTVDSSNSVDNVSFAIDRHGKASGGAGQDQDLSSVRDSTETGVRRRHKGQAPSAEADGEPADEQEQSQESSAEAAQAHARSSDPLRWFGVLVPPSLRSAQTCFVDALGRAAQLATLQAKCDRLRHQYLAEKADSCSS
ncbi:coiled-coil domain-containing protein 115-like [Sycon ciliatum]|uniref:coiled-coil domain-containing protein 115-like n=1 Tax=Sycon ciliatum TaxID=27933 RepID=UPI0031F64144